LSKKSKRKNEINRTSKNKIWIIIAIVIIALVAIFVIQFSGSTPNNNGGTPSEQGASQEQNQQTTTSITGVGDACKQDSECLLASCKNAPNAIKCVNALHEELYYKDCGNDPNKVLPATKDFTICACIQGICTVLNK
jgi:hypothetical protein